MMPDQRPALAVRKQVLPTDRADDFLSSVLNYSLVNVMNGRESRIGLCRQVSISCWLISQRNSIGVLPTGVFEAIFLVRGGIGVSPILARLAFSLAVAFWSRSNSSRSWLMRIGSS